MICGGCLKREEMMKASKSFLLTSFDLIKPGKNLTQLESSSRWNNEGCVWNYSSNGGSKCFLIRHVLK
jgi:hypothetical protein